MGLTVTDVGLDKKLAEHELKKHAATIHCSNTLSLLQRKISNALLYHAYKELMLKEEHEISVKQLCKLISYHGNNHAVIKEALKDLLSTIIEWNVVNDTTGAEDWTASSILASVSLQGPLCLYAYSPRMKQLLHSPSMFGKINLFIQSRFKSSYGLALYENCIRYRGLPFTKWFEMDTFRKIMGVPDDKYTIFRDFKKRVIDKSIEEVNTYSDLIIEPEVSREGRLVVKVRFHLKERAKKTRLGMSEEGVDPKEDASLITLKSKLMAQFGLSAEQAQLVMTEYEEAFIAEKIILVEESINYQQGRILNVAGYFLSALKNNYLPGKVSVNLVKEKTAQRKEVKQVADKIRKDYSSYREEKIDLAVAKWKNEEKASFLEKFYLHAEQAIQTILQLQRNKYTRVTVLNSPQIKAQMRQFVLQEYPVIQEELLTIEQFVEKLSGVEREAWEESKLV